MKANFFDQSVDKVATQQVFEKPSQEVETPNSGFWQTIVAVIKSPKKFFEQSQSRSLAASVSYCYKLGVVSGLIASIGSLFIRGGYQKLSHQIGASFQSSLFFIVGYVVIFGLAIFVVIPAVFILLNFIRSGFNYFVLRFFHATGTYADTFHAFAYGSTSVLLFSWLPSFLGAVAGMYSLGSTWIGLSNNHQMSLNRVMWASIMGDIIVGFLVVMVSIFAIAILKP